MCYERRRAEASERERERERERELYQRERERERERALLGTKVHNGWSRAAPTVQTPHHQALSCFPAYKRWGSILHGENFPRTMMRGWLVPLSLFATARRHWA